MDVLECQFLITLNIIIQNRRSGQCLTTNATVVGSIYYLSFSALVDENQHMPCNLFSTTFFVCTLLQALTTCQIS